MRKSLVLLAALTFVACSRDEAGGEADTTKGIDVDVGLKTDTVTVPTFGTVKDTIIVDKPVVTGKKSVEVKRPTVDVNKRP
jgi:hypothetical protein